MKNLLTGTEHELIVLVRNVEKAEALIQTFPQEQQSRIKLVSGNITEPHFGLSDDCVKQLTNQVDTFYHAAALVKFDADLRDELFAINYEGTRHALDLAKALNVNTFFYVSTAYTVGKHQHGVEALYPLDNAYHNPYEESKVASEHLVFAYGNDMDVSIFRPSIIVGDSKTGEADSEFTLYGFMRALDIFKRRTAKKDDAHTTYRVVANREGTSNFVPVDYVADILSLALTKAEPNKIYNIINPDPPNNIDILNLFKQALHFERLSIVEDTQNYELSAEEEKLNNMIVPFKVYLAGSIQFEDSNTQELIRDSDINHLNLTHETVRMIINEYFSA